MSCISQFARYVIFIFNFLMAICALTMIIFGIIYYMYEDRGINVFSDLGDIFSLGILAIIIGVLIFFIAAFGCCGALHENTCLLSFYGVVLVILFAVQVAVGILAILKIVDKNDFLDYVRRALLKIFDKIDEVDGRKTFYQIQKIFMCCGVDGPEDYNITATGYPISCCGVSGYICFTPYSIGCAEGFTNKMTEYIRVIAYVALAFAGIELLGAIFSFLVRRENIKNKLKIEDLHSIEETSI